MGEIKSAIELAMERTRNLVMDEQEKRDASLREVEQKLTALIRRFAGGMIDERQVLEQYGRVEGKESLKRSVAMDRLVGEVETRGLDESIFALLDMVAGSVLGGEIEAFRERSRQEMKSQEARIRGKIEDRLKAMGISGSAAEPNIAAWDEWNEAIEQTKDIFKKQVAQWKQRLASTLP